MACTLWHSTSIANSNHQHFRMIMTRSTGARAVGICCCMVLTSIAGAAAAAVIHGDLVVVADQGRIKVNAMQRLYGRHKAT